MRRGSISVPAAHVGEMSLDGGGSSHGGADKVGPSTAALASFKIAVAGRCATLAGAEDIGIHAQAHGAARVAPLEAGALKNFRKAFLFGGAFHFLRSRHNNGAH